MMILAVIVLVFLAYMYNQRTKIESMKYNPETFYYLDPTNAANTPGRFGLNGADPVTPPSCGADGKTTPCDPAKFASVNLLPKENDVVRDDAFEFAPKDLTTINFLDAKSKIGENSIGNSLRNPNMQLRSEPANPQTPVSPWSNSTIEPDLYRQPWE